MTKDVDASGSRNCSLSIVSRAGEILAKRMDEYYKRQDRCEKCGGTGWIEPESGDELIDIPYQCDHRTSVELLDGL